MKIQFASDLHLEFPENKEYLRKNPLVPTGDILILAGDIVPFSALRHHSDFFKYVSDHFHTTYWVPGNHEYYHFDVTKKPSKLHENIRPNVHLVNNVSILHEDIKMIFTTLWSDIDPANQCIVNRLADFRLIQYGPFRLTIDRYNKLHRSSLDFLTQELENNHSGPCLVVSHHIPTFRNYPEKYRNSELNEAFAVELSDFIEKYQPDYWIYGHHHTNVPPLPYRQNGTNHQSTRLHRPQ